MSDLPIDQDLFDILVCPLSREPLKYIEGLLVSTDGKTRRAYRIDDGIPVMLIDESETLSSGEWQRLMDAKGPVGGGIAALEARDATDDAAPGG